MSFDSLGSASAVLALMKIQKDRNPKRRPHMIKIELSAVKSVYSGKAHKCACGCSGKYSYASKHVEESSKRRGYKVDAEEVSDRSVKIITDKVCAAPDVEIQEGLGGEVMVSAVVGERVYVVRI